MAKTLLCKDCGIPAVALYLDAYGPEKHKPVCAVDASYYVSLGEEMGAI